MRETRLSGSVEGVVSNHDPYSDWNLPCNTRSQIALIAPTLGASEVFDQWMKAGTWLK